MVENVLNSVLTVNVLWVYLVAAAAVFVQSMGIPFAGDIAALMAAAFAAEGITNPVLVVLAVTIGSCAGSALGYWFGARGLRPLLFRFAERHPAWLSANDLTPASRVSRLGAGLLFVARFSGPTRFLTGLVPGALRMPVVPFAVITVVSSVAWAVLVVATMLLLGKGVVHGVHLWVLTVGVCALMVAATSLVFTVRHRRHIEG